MKNLKYVSIVKYMKELIETGMEFDKMPLFISTGDRFYAVNNLDVDYENNRLIFIADSTNTDTRSLSSDALLKMYDETMRGDDETLALYLNQLDIVGIVKKENPDENIMINFYTNKASASVYSLGESANGPYMFSIKDTPVK